MSVGIALTERESVLPFKTGHRDAFKCQRDLQNLQLCQHAEKMGMNQLTVKNLRNTDGFSNEGQHLCPEKGHPGIVIFVLKFG